MVEFRAETGWQLVTGNGGWPRSETRQTPSLPLVTRWVLTIVIANCLFEAFIKSHSVFRFPLSGLSSMYLLRNPEPNKDACYQYHIECHVVDILKHHNFRSHSNPLHFIAIQIWVMYDTMDDFWLTDLPALSSSRFSFRCLKSRSIESLKHLIYFLLYLILTMCISHSSVTSFTVYCLRACIVHVHSLLASPYCYWQAQALNPNPKKSKSKGVFNEYVQVLQGLSILNAVMFFSTFSILW